MARNETLRTCHHNGHLRLQTRGELSETGGAAPYFFPLRTRLPGRYGHGEPQFTYSVKAIVIMLLTIARGTTSRRIGTFQRGE